MLLICNAPEPSGSGRWCGSAPPQKRRVARENMNGKHTLSSTLCSRLHPAPTAIKSRHQPLKQMKTLIVTASMALTASVASAEGLIPAAPDGDNSYSVNLVQHQGHVYVTVHGESGLRAIFKQQMVGSLPRNPEEAGKLAVNILYVHTHKGGEIAGGSFHFHSGVFFIPVRPTAGEIGFNAIVVRNEREYNERWVRPRK